jgi:phenylpropionate dioxygenase-like ring-hydroxylating dioxygenase large terminal subunit
MADHPTTPNDERTPPSAIWKTLETLKGDDLTAWRLADVPDRPSADERNLPKVYPFGWYGIGYSDELEIGQVKALRYFGQEIALWRGIDGTVRVIDAYCAHYGAHMGHGGKVHENYLECPFHAWRYDETGATKEIPYASVIPPQARRKNCVPSWPTREANGFIYIWYHPDKVDPLWDLQVIDEIGHPDWTPFKKFEWNIYSSLENIADNAVDFAHFRYVHGTTNLPTYEIKYDGRARSVIARAKLGTPRGLVDAAISSYSFGPGQGYVKFSGLSDTMLVPAVTPVDRDHVKAFYAFTQPRAEAEGPMAGLAKALIKDICKQFDQDKVILDRHRRVEPPLVCNGDGPFGRNRVYYSQFYAGHTPAPIPEAAE